MQHSPRSAGGDATRQIAGANALVIAMARCWAGGRVQRARHASVRTSHAHPERPGSGHAHMHMHIYIYVYTYSYAHACTRMHMHMQRGTHTPHGQITTMRMRMLIYTHAPHAASVCAPGASSLCFSAFHNSCTVEGVGVVARARTCTWYMLGHTRAQWRAHTHMCIHTARTHTAWMHAERTHAHGCPIYRMVHVSKLCLCVRAV